MTAKLFSCPLCDSEFLGVTSGTNPHYLRYQCKEPDCRFIFSATRSEVEKAGVHVPFAQRATDEKTPVEYRTPRVSIHSSQFGNGR